MRGIPPIRAIPIPRGYEINRTIHAEKRAFSPRHIPLELIDETIRRGSAINLAGEKGRHGGDMFKFTKTHMVKDDAGTRRSKPVVVICEICGNVCHVVTTYNA